MSSPSAPNLPPPSPKAKRAKATPDPKLRPELQEMETRLEAMKEYQEGLYLIKRKEIEIAELRKRSSELERKFPELASTKSFLFKRKTQEKESKEDANQDISPQPPPPTPQRDPQLPATLPPLSSAPQSSTSPPTEQMEAIRLMDGHPNYPRPGGELWAAESPKRKEM